jgi:chitin synthase
MVIDFLYIVCLGILVYHSLTIRKQTPSSKRTFNTIASWLGILGLFFIVLIFINFYQALFTPSSNLIVDDGIFTQQTFIYLLIGIVGAHVIVVLSALNCYTYYEILVCMLSYFFYAPAYINLFFVYSFCRIDDLSWGTKGLDA